MSAADERSSKARREMRRRPGVRAPAPATRAPVPSTPPASPSWRDPWGWVSLLALVPLVLRSLGAPLGEPVADDFDHLHYALFSPRYTWLDGGGSASFWRPLAYQGYFGLLKEPILAAPLTVVVLHLALLAAAVLLLYRTARRFMPGSWAAAAASFPLLIESARALIAVPIHFVDVGLIFFSALAVHEAAASRMVPSLLALGAALLCKETAVATALLLPWLPPRRRGAAGRGRWLAGAMAVTLAWGLTYLAVRADQGLTLPRGLESSLGVLPATLMDRVRWAIAGTVRGLVSLPLATSRWDIPCAVAMALILIGATVRFARSAPARARFAGVTPIVACGVLWCAAATAPLVTVHPIWSPQRVVFPGIGAGVALAATLGAAHPGLLAASVVVRLAMFSLAPGPPAQVTMVPSVSGAFVDFERLARLQRLMVETRTALKSGYPTLPRGARVGFMHPPIAATYAFGGDKALQIWYRDTTLHLLRYSQFRGQPDLSLSAVVEFEQHGNPQVVLVSPEAMRHYLKAVKLVQAEAWQPAFDELALADSAQTDQRARGFLGRIAGRRAFSLFGVSRLEEAEREARRGLALWPDGSDARYSLAAVMAFTGRRPQAMAQVETLLKLYPGDRSARALRDSLRSRMGR